MAIKVYSRQTAILCGECWLQSDSNTPVCRCENDISRVSDAPLRKIDSELSREIQLDLFGS